MTKLSVSVIIPTYNRAHLIERALKSALAQIKDGDEIIIVDDGSNDNTEEVLKAYRDKIIFIKIKNSGAGAARNRGIKEARCDLIAFLDSDDEWMDGKLALQRKLLESKDEILFTFSDIAITSSQGKIFRNYLKHWHNDSRRWDDILSESFPYSEISSDLKQENDFNVYVGDLYPLLATGIYVVTITLVVRRERALANLYFEEDLPTYEDWICFGRIAKLGPGAYTDIELAWQHSHEGFRLTDASSLVTSETRLKILERLWGKDEKYLFQHGEIYEELIETQKRIRTASLISLGRAKEARIQLKELRNPPSIYRLLALLPGWLASLLLKIRRALRTAFS